MEKFLNYWKAVYRLIRIVYKRELRRSKDIKEFIKCMLYIFSVFYFVFFGVLIFG